MNLNFNFWNIVYLISVTNIIMSVISCFSDGYHHLRRSHGGAGLRHLRHLVDRSGSRSAFGNLQVDGVESQPKTTVRSFFLCNVALPHAMRNTKIHYIGKIQFFMLAASGARGYILF
jgi:hypothetical protein